MSVKLKMGEAKRRFTKGYRYTKFTWGGTLVMDVFSKGSAMS